MAYGRNVDDVAAWNAQRAAVKAKEAHALTVCSCKNRVSGGTYMGQVVCKLCHRWFPVGPRVTNRLRGYW